MEDKKPYIMFYEDCGGCTIGSAIYDTDSFNKCLESINRKFQRAQERYLKELNELNRIKKELNIL